MKQEIKKILGRKNWSVICQRLLNVLESNSVDINDIVIKQTSDYYFSNRKHHFADENVKKWYNIGTKNYGGTYAYIFVGINK